MTNTSHIRTGYLLGIFVSLFFFVGAVLPVYAGANDNVSGYAWHGERNASTGAVGGGWISFNCTNNSVSFCNNIANYGVHIETSNRSSNGTNNITGYAWDGNADTSAGVSGGLGWLYMDPSGPYPEAPNYSAQIDWSTGEISGWARFVSVSSGGAGGWDGWVKLGPGWSNSVSLSGNTFSGYAWGGNRNNNTQPIGWVDFNPSSYGGVTFNTEPLARNFSVNGGYRGDTLSILPENNGAGDGESNITLVSWSNPSEGNITDTNDGSSGQIQIDYMNTSGTDGQDSFTYTVEDAQGETDTGTITVNYGWCGNNNVDPAGSEVCDGSDLNGQTCSSRGYEGGTLSCNASCDGFDESQCTTKCGDGIDNDGDGLTDEKDPGCWTDPADPYVDSSNPGSYTNDPLDPTGTSMSEDNCGNNYCESISGENPNSCPADCDPSYQEI